MTRQDEFYAILANNSGGIEPLENWLTADIVKLIELMDTELQRRSDDVQSLFEIEENDFDDPDY